MLTWSVYKVVTRIVFHAISDGLAVEEADVIVGGRSDGEALLAVPDNVPLVWFKAKVGELWEDRDNTDETLVPKHIGIKKGNTSSLVNECCQHSGVRKRP